MTLEIQFLAWDRYKNMVCINQIMGSQPFPLDNRISNGNTYAKNVNTDDKKPIQNLFPLKKTTYYHKK